MCSQACVCILVCVLACMHVEAKGQPQVSFPRCCLSRFVTVQAGKASWPASPKDLLVFTSPALGLQACTSKPGFFLKWGFWKWSISHSYDKHFIHQALFPAHPRIYFCVLPLNFGSVLLINAALLERNGMFHDHQMTCKPFGHSIRKKLIVKTWSGWRTGNEMLVEGLTKMKGA